MIDALFCACLPHLDTPEKSLRRDLFRMVDLEGIALAEASEALGISHAHAVDLQERTRREIAVLLTLGLGPPGGATLENEPMTGCCCATPPKNPVWRT
ncbi:hypothetical protein [Pseudaestuariivita atlantica]|uniref:RNA polymerase sigma factor 70 region 4 type 2 domain-containing protein n=1 Tax=Pseudaestuariivita atlantica TaxID=1317121 RepID=A0A0L1JSA5_9RHOB|nr:hypothetical protein [Pseudaestuariivita atlantica]KNG94582.1 hypothetical protein ATO11_04020 [Pseudaestuariivita atlantica]